MGELQLEIRTYNGLRLRSQKSNTTFMFEKTIGRAWMFRFLILVSKSFLMRRYENLYFSKIVISDHIFAGFEIITAHL